MPRSAYRDEYEPEECGPWLHPAPGGPNRVDHRDTANREQCREPSHLHGIWKRAVETLAAELQIEPYEAHNLLIDAGDAVTRGLAWEWWL